MFITCERWQLYFVRACSEVAPDFFFQVKLSISIYLHITLCATALYLRESKKKITLALIWANALFSY